MVMATAAAMASVTAGPWATVTMMERAKAMAGRLVKVKATARAWARARVMASPGARTRGIGGNW